MAHWNVEVPSLQSTPEEREDVGNAVLKHNNALLLDCALCPLALSVDRGSELFKIIAGDALLPQQ